MKSNFLSACRWNWSCVCLLWRIIVAWTLHRGFRAQNLALDSSLRKSICKGWWISDQTLLTTWTWMIRSFSHEFFSNFTTQLRQKPQTTKKLLLMELDSLKQRSRPIPILATHEVSRVPRWCIATHLTASGSTPHSHLKTPQTY